jgi:hypothetical protein
MHTHLAWHTVGGILHTFVVRIECSLATRAFQNLGKVYGSPWFLKAALALTELRFHHGKDIPHTALRGGGSAPVNCMHAEISMSELVVVQTQ